MFEQTSGLAFPVFSILFLALHLAALVLLWRATRRSHLSKVLWTIGIVFFPLLGALGWLVTWGLETLTHRFNSKAG